MMLLVALMSAFDRPDVGGMLGCVNMFVMIGMGVYCLVTAKKPENRSRIRSGKFSLSASLRKKLKVALGYDPILNRIGEGYLMGGREP